MRFVLVVGCALVLAGCQNSSSNPPVAGGGGGGHDHGHDHGHSHGHSHDAGPNGGHLIEVGEHAYHLEWTHDDETGEVVVYVLDEEIDEQVNADNETLVIQVKVGDEVTEYELTNDDGDGQGTSKYSITDKPLIEALKLAGEGVEVTTSLTVEGEKFDITFEHEAH